MPVKEIKNIGAAGATVFTTPKHVVGKIKSINIDNKTSGPQTITIHDVFSGDVSNGVASPTVNSGVLLQTTLQSGEFLSIKAEELDGVRTFGIVAAYATASGDYTMTVGYCLE